MEICALRVLLVGEYDGIEMLRMAMCRQASAKDACLSQQQLRAAVAVALAIQLSHVHFGNQSYIHQELSGLYPSCDCELYN